jgi:hypothetical protein
MPARSPVMMINIKQCMMLEVMAHKKIRLGNNDLVKSVRSHDR